MQGHAQRSVRTQDTSTGLCATAPAGASELADAPCDASSLAQRWRVASLPSPADRPVNDSGAAALAVDSRLEAALHAGACAYLRAAGGLQFGDCLADDGARVTTNKPAAVRTLCARYLQRCVPFL